MDFQRLVYSVVAVAFLGSIGGFYWSQWRTRALAKKHNAFGRYARKIATTVMVVFDTKNPDCPPDVARTYEKYRTVLWTSVAISAASLAFFAFFGPARWH